MKAFDFFSFCGLPFGICGSVLLLYYFLHIIHIYLFFLFSSKLLSDVYTLIPLIHTQWYQDVHKCLWTCAIWFKRVLKYLFVNFISISGLPDQNDVLIEDIERHGDIYLHVCFFSTYISLYFGFFIGKREWSWLILNLVATWFFHSHWCSTVNFCKVYAVRKVTLPDPKTWIPVGVFIFRVLSKRRICKRYNHSIARVYKYKLKVLFGLIKKLNNLLVIFAFRIFCWFWIMHRFLIFFFYFC